MTILLADDEPVLRSAVARILTNAGYQVLTADSGPQALQLNAGLDGPIHLLMTDIVMPGMTGPELARQLQAVRPGLRVLFTSGYTEESSEYAIPSALYLAKPYHVADLLRKVRDILGDAPPL